MRHAAMLFATLALARPAWADDGVQAELPARWRAALSLEESFAGEQLRDDERGVVTSAAKSKLELQARPIEAIRVELAVVGRRYDGATTLPAARYLPAPTRSLLINRDAAAGTPGTADLLTFELADAAYLHQAFAELASPHLRLRVGRQTYRVGAGAAYRPTDLLNFASPADPMWEPEGRDAVLIGATVGSFHMEAFAQRAPQASWVGRAWISSSGWRLGASFTHHTQPRTDWQAVNSAAALTSVAAGGMGGFVRDFRWNLAAAEVEGAAGGVNLRGEVGYAFVGPVSESGTLERAGRDHLRLLAGADHTFRGGLTALVEYMYLGQGRVRAADLDFNDRLALLAGEVLTASRHSAFISVEKPVAGRLALGLRGSISLMDPVNAMLFPFVGWTHADWGQLSLQGALPTGRRHGLIGNAGPSLTLWLKLQMQTSQRL
jgi:hypothetical protein